MGFDGSESMDTSANPKAFASVGSCTTASGNAPKNGYFSEITKSALCPEESYFVFSYIFPVQCIHFLYPVSSYGGTPNIWNTSACGGVVGFR